MAEEKKSDGMIKTLVNAFKNKDIRKKILITIGLLLIYRLAAYIPVPGIAPGAFDTGGAVGTGAGGMLWLLSSLSGGALANGALVAIGIGPYINASIIIQLLTVAIPKLEQWSKQGEDGKKKIANVTRIITLVLAVIQATGIVVNYALTGFISPIFGPAVPTAVVAVFVAVVLVAGAMVTMWIGERITEHGVGNGISLLIFVGILSSAGLAVIAEAASIGPNDQAGIWYILGFLGLVLAIFVFIVFIDLSERRIPIQYAKQIKGRKQYGGQSTFIPIKVNAAGVLPIIFANAIISFPSLLFSLIPIETGGWGRFMAVWDQYLGINTPIYIAITGILIFFFSFFYARIQFNPEEVSKNIQQYGGFIPGIRPGKNTQEYLQKVTSRITFWGALFLAFIAIVPNSLFAALVPAGSNLLHGFTATGMLIIVSVALEFEKQLQSQLMMKQYKGFLK